MNQFLNQRMKEDKELMERMDLDIELFIKQTKKELLYKIFEEVKNIKTDSPFFWDYVNLFLRKINKDV